MTRKITLIILLIFLIVCCYTVTFGNQEFIRNKISGVNELKTSSEELKLEAAKLEKTTTDDFNKKKEKLAKTIKEYKKAKQEYESIIPDYTDVAESMEGVNLKDIYDIDFLWTILGNYATEEGVDLKFDVSKNTTSASSINNSSTNYVVCDLQFVAIGNYISLTDFIYDMEDDDRLSFEINDFTLEKYDAPPENTEDGKEKTELEKKLEEEKRKNTLKATLNVKEIKINATSLIQAVEIDETQNDDKENEKNEDKKEDANKDNTNTTVTNEVEEVKTQVVDSKTSNSVN